MGQRWGAGPRGAKHENALHFHNLPAKMLAVFTDMLNFGLPRRAQSFTIPVSGPLMQDSILVRTLQLLSQEEFDTLELFVASPIFNEINRFNDTVRLFEYLKRFYPDFTDQRLDKNAVGAELYPSRTHRQSEVERSMAQLMHIVKQFINFRYSAVKGGRMVRGGRKNNYLQDPVALLNFARQQLALMRFYSERLLQKPVDNIRQKEPVSTPKPATDAKKRRVKRTENLFHNLYQELEEVFQSQTRFNHFEEYEFSDFFYFRYLSEQEKTVYESLHEWSAQGGFVSLLEATEKLDRFYLLGKLDQMCKLLHLQHIAMPFETDTDEYRRLATNQTLTVKMVKLLIKNNFDKDDPGIALYFMLLKLLAKKKTEKTDTLADAFFTLLQQHQSLIPVKRFKDFNVMVRSYWARRYRLTRDRQFLERQFRSHQEDLQLTRQTGEAIQSSHFQNMLLNAIKLGHLDWAAGFIAEFSGKISATQETELVVDTGRAMLFFAQKKYDAAAQCLPHYFTYGASDDTNLYLLAATLDLRIRYELDTLLDDESVNMKRATHKRIKENKSLPPERRDGVLAFYECAIQLFRQKERLQMGAVNCAAMRQEMEKIAARLAEKTAVEAEWLREKQAEILEALDVKCPKTESK